MRKEKFKQCTLHRSDGDKTYKMVEWLQEWLAVLGKEVFCAGHRWTVVHVGQESGDPRSAHECTT